MKAMKAMKAMTRKADPKQAMKRKGMEAPEPTTPKDTCDAAMEKKPKVRLATRRAFTSAVEFAAPTANATNGFSKVVFGQQPTNPTGRVLGASRPRWSTTVPLEFWM